MINFLKLFIEMYSTYTEEFDLIVHDIIEEHKKLHNNTNEDVNDIKLSHAPHAACRRHPLFCLNWFIDKSIMDARQASCQWWES